jgi:TPP-dependent pyruvate/acetoin dehydrogenase alpha subunit
MEKVVPGRAEALKMYKTMATIREFETVAGRLFAEGRLPGFIHLSIGQEAVAAGVCAALRSDDQIATTHRGHGHCIAKGGNINRMMAELHGGIDGYCKGRAGSMHIADPALGILGANGIVGGGLPMAVGAAYASQVQELDRVAVAFFGEGAVAEGSFHESLNLAALWNLPVIFVCENNLYAEMSHISLHLKGEDVYRKAEAYGMRGVVVDGNDLLAVYAAACEAVSQARAGQGPTLIECKTYRWHGHFEGDPQRYRDPAEVEEWRGRDPLVQFRAYMLTRAMAAAAELEELHQAVSGEVAAAVRFGEASPKPPSSILFEDVYSSGAAPAERQGGTR